MANKAAWLTASQARPLTVDDAPMPVPSANEIVVRNHAVAINPVDWAVQATGMLPLPYPHIGGCDSAGEITAVGSSVKDLKVGDRVVASLDPYGSQDSRRGAFQLFSLAREAGSAKIPENISYSEAAVLPLAVSTSASALFQADTLGLQLPTSERTPTGKVVLIWGGSTSLGACAIQLVHAAGYDVATTSSIHNLNSMKSLGAKYVFDHAKENVVEDIITELKHSDFGGVYCAILTPEVIRQCADIATKLDGKKFVSTVLAPAMPLPDSLPSDIQASKGETLTSSLPYLGESK
jgi:NADPH:quinone reductase-like Zn-dependent oxidoreductase